MNYPSKLFVAYLFWLFVAQQSNAAIWNTVEPSYIGGGKWSLKFIDQGGTRRKINSTTPGLHGFLFPNDAILLVQENFEDGSQYKIYAETKNGLVERYKLKEMQSAWKILPSIRGRSFLFVRDISDYDEMENVIKHPDLFTMIEWQSPNNGVRLNCGIRQSFLFDKRKFKGKSLLDAVGSVADLSCHDR
jgi:hypothetical protein